VGWHKTLFPNWLSLTCAALTEWVWEKIPQTVAQTHSL
jgi:hypothetical protein